MRGPGASASLSRALTAAAAKAGTSITIAHDEAVPWSSATFNGARHHVEATTPLGAAAWLAEIEQAELPLSGHLLAGLAVTGRAEHGGFLHVQIEALTVQTH